LYLRISGISHLEVREHMVVVLKDFAVQKSIDNDNFSKLFFRSTTMGHILASIPPDYVQKALSETNRHSIRERILPNSVMVLFPILLGLHMDLPYGEVFKDLQNAYEWFGLERPEEFPNESALVKARKRLGYEPLEHLFKQVVSQQAIPKSPDAYYKGLLLTAIDGCIFDVEDSKENAIFGHPQNQNGAGAYPQVSSVMLVNFYTRSLMDVEFGTVAGTGEQTIAKEILRRLKEGTLNLADRLYLSYESWNIASSTGAHLLWRVKSDFRLDPIEHLKDGSYTAKLYKYDANRKRLIDEYSIVRVIEYSLMTKTGKKKEKKGKEVYRLVTTLLDPKEAPADELAELYPMRYWVSEGFNKEIKAILKAPRIVLRSKTPVMVIQELYGLLLAQYAVRAIMEESAEKAGVEPARISFQNAVYVLRRHLTQAFASQNFFIVKHS
jgi:hypothetical protein